MEIPVKDTYDFNGVSRGEGPCICCGTDVLVAKYRVHMVEGGGIACTPDEDDKVDPAGDQDMQPIGGNEQHGCVKWLKDNHSTFFMLFVRKA